MKLRMIHVVGARPNFMKVGPVLQALENSKFEQILVHTGQHYDINMSDIFFKQLGIKAPNLNLEVGSASHSVQTAQIMIRFEEVIQKERPHIVLVYGDVNSTVAAALVCSKAGIRVGHVEAGLRSYDRSMPEEINRVLTDQLADILFTPSPDADTNLAREGIPTHKIKFVGNVMIDTLVRFLPGIGKPNLPGLNQQYLLVTLHRPANVDEPYQLARIVEALVEISGKLQVVFPVHPRTRKRIVEAGKRIPDNGRIILLDPLGYIDFLTLQKNAMAVVTDSGGVQEETTYLGVPCFTLRSNTERPVTIQMGTNIMIGDDYDRLTREIGSLLHGRVIKRSIPALWDGKAAERIAACLDTFVF